MMVTDQVTEGSLRLQARSASKKKAVKVGCFVRLELYIRGKCVPGLRAGIKKEFFEHFISMGQELRIVVSQMYCTVSAVTKVKTRLAVQILISGRRVVVQGRMHDIRK